jgi:hypothetical protein
MERAVARRAGGTRSPTSGSMICFEKIRSMKYPSKLLRAKLTGVTVVTDDRQFRQRKTPKELVMQSPIHNVAVMNVKRRMNGLLRTISPSGQMKMIPVTYPAWLQVGIKEALS